MIDLASVSALFNRVFRVFGCAKHPACAETRSFDRRLMSHSAGIGFQMCFHRVRRSVLIAQAACAVQAAKSPSSHFNGCV